MNLIILDSSGQYADNQSQTKDTFSDKWEEVEKMDDVETLYKFQYDWFIKLYGFESEEDLAIFLQNKKTIIDTGCGLGYKAAWFARLAPHATVVGIDISDAVNLAAKNFKEYKTIYFIKGDIANTHCKPNSFDFTVCDQVIMHTEVPEKTFSHLSEITSSEGEFACYVYRKKALPRELLDDYFRTQTQNISKDEMWAFSEQLTTLGKNLSNLKINVECPDIPVLGIKGGTYDVQRLIYWNFLKCFWRDDWSFELNTSCSFDWYAPSNAKRFNKEEFYEMINGNNLKVSSFHEEEACYSGRFSKS
jgi:ubiquinone/menaquinone biosynthesis C-methylase UbiE